MVPRIRTDRDVAPSALTTVVHSYCPGAGKVTTTLLRKYSFFLPILGDYVYLLESFLLTKNFSLKFIKMSRTHVYVAFIFPRSLHSDPSML